MVTVPCAAVDPGGTLSFSVGMGTKSDRPDAEHGRGLRGRQPIPEQERQRFLMCLGQPTPRLHEQDVVHDAVRLIQRHPRLSVGDPHRDRLLPALTPLLAEQHVAGNAEDPRPGRIVATRKCLHAAPDDQERLGDDVLDLRGIDASTHEPPDVVDAALVGGVESPILCWIAHTLYLSVPARPYRPEVDVRMRAGTSRQLGDVRGLEQGASEVSLFPVLVPRTAV